MLPKGAGSGERGSLVTGQVRAVAGGDGKDHFAFGRECF